MWCASLSHRALATALSLGVAQTWLPTDALAQPAPISQEFHPVSISSGKQSNSGLEYAVVFSEVIDLGDVPWLRVFFDGVGLEGGSYVRVTSEQDGATQTLGRQAIGEWQNSTAYFNGPAVTLELIAAPQTSENWISVEKVLVGTESSASEDPSPRRVCIQADGRVASANAATARLLTAGLGGGCSGFIIDRAPLEDLQDRCMLTAGHCRPDISHMVVQFETIPASKQDCSLQHPPPAKQFVVKPASVVFADAEPGFFNVNGNDWAVFRVARNAVTNLTNFQTQGAAFPLAAPAVGPATKFGYGADGPTVNTDIPLVINCRCPKSQPQAANMANQTQQTHTATITAVSPAAVRHTIHDCGGDSGEVIVQNASAAGIGTHGNCVAGPTPANSGTSITHAPLQDAIAAVCSGLDNFQCYGARPRRLPIELRDQFEDPDDPDDVETALIKRGRGTTTFCNPVIKNGEPIIDKGAHLTCYPMRRVPPFERRDVFVQNQLAPGLQRLTVRRPRSLCLPSQKDAPDPDDPNKALPPPIALDHFKCYRVSGRPVTQIISLEDQFGTKETVVGRPKLLCNPVEKVIGAETVGIANPLSHLVCYRILARLPGANLMVQARNQFGVQKLKIGRSRTLCVRSAKFP